jgi:hypothetical protein
MVARLAEAGAQADVVVVCVFTDEQVRQVCLDSALMSTMPPGSVLVIHTTASPKTIEAIAARCHDVDVVDASFAEARGEFIGKDVAVVRDLVEQFDSDLGVLDDVIDAIGIAGKV